MPARIGPRAVSDSSLNQAIAIATQARHGRAPKLGSEALRERLEAILTATGVLSPDTVAEEFRKAVAAQAEHSEILRRLTRIRRTANPLTAMIPDPKIPGLDSELRNALRTGIGPKRSANLPVETYRWHELTKSQRRCFWNVIGGFIKYHKQFSGVGAPHKTAFDTVIIELAQPYAELKGPRSHAHLLSHAERSRFVQFVHAVASPFAPELTLKAIANRWSDLKDALNSGGSDEAQVENKP